MNKQTLIWTLIVAVPVALAAVAAGYIYSDTGRLPFQGSAETSPAPATSSNTADKGNAADATTSSTGKDSSVETAETEDSGSATDEKPVKGPQFDVVGVEPTGETVVAGRSDAGAIVALTANGKVVGTSIANKAGEWTIILDEPLKPGDYDVGLEVRDEKGTSLETSEQHLAVSVPKDGKEKPLVVLNSPDGPSDILQKPESGAEMQVAASSDTAPVEETRTSAASGEGEPQAAETATAEALTADEPADAGQQQAGGTSAADQSKTQEAQVAATSPETADEAPSGTSQTAAASQESEAEQTAAALESSDETSGDAAPTVTVEAVESEKDKVYIAGTGEPGSSVRVYVGDEYQGEAKVNPSGKWLVQGDKNLSEGNVEIRADLIGGDGDEVDARAAVTFDKEQDQQIVLTKVVATGVSDGSEGQGAEVKKSLPVVIIRKGDNLWRISRRLYGEGFRYTTIYQANQDQIRDPDLIYPGQVFLTPEGDLNWPAPPKDDDRNG